MTSIQLRFKHLVSCMGDPPTASVRLIWVTNQGAFQERTHPTALGAHWPQFLGHSKMTNDSLLCQLNLFPAHFQRQKRGLGAKGENPEISVHHRGTVEPPQADYDSKGSNSEQRWARPGSECPRVNRLWLEMKTLCLSLRFICLWNNVPSFKPQKKKWELVFLPQ